MKKLILLIALISAMIPMKAESYELLYEYNDDENTAIVTGYTGTIKGMLTINKYANSHIVVGIAANAFAGCESMTGVTMPSEIKWIGENAFLGCIAIDRMGIASSLQNWMNVDLANEYSNPMCYGADFYDQDRNQLTSLTLPSTATEVKPYSFYGANFTGTLQLGRASINKIGKGAFQNCSFKNAVTFPVTLMEIGENAFTGNSFSEVTFDESDIELNITNNQFSKAKTVNVGRDLVLSKNGECPFVRKVKEGVAINYKTSLITANIGESVSLLPSQLFSHCGNLTTVNLPETGNLTSIGDSVFFFCNYMKEIIIPEGVVEIGKSAFSNCYQLANVQLPSTLTTIGTSIFSGCDDLPSIELPDKITVIPADAFYGCTNLSNVILPSGVKEIGSWAFAYVNNAIMTVIIPSTIEVIGKHAFAYGRATHVNFINGASNLRYIGDNAFLYSYPVVVGLEFKDCKKLEYIGVRALENVYGIIDVTLTDCENLTTIGENAFIGSTIENLVIQNCPKLEYIGLGAFNSNNSLASVTIGNLPSLNYMGSSLFAKCYHLRTADFTELNYNTIPEYMFSDCNLKELKFGEDNNIVSIGERAFYSFDIADFDFSIFKNVESIGREAFHTYHGPEVLDLSGMTNLTSIARGVFDSNKNMVEIILPASLKDISFRIVERCENLQRIVCLGEEPVIVDQPLILPEGVALVVPEGSEIGYAISNWSTTASINNYLVNDNVLEAYNKEGITYDIDLNGKTASVVNSISNLSLVSALIPYSLDGAVPVTGVGANAFNGSQNLELVKLPFTVSQIGSGAFEGCNNLNEILVMASVPPMVGEDAFLDISEEAEVMVRPDYLEAYEEDEIWSQLPLVEAPEIPIDALQIIFAGKATNEINVNVGQNIRLFANILPLEHTWTNLDWTCEGLEYDVLDNGIFECTPKKAGKYTVNLTAQNILLRDGESSSVSSNCIINVNDIMPVGLIITGDSELYSGLESQLSIDWLPMDVTNPSIEFSSSDPEIVSVDNRGVIKGLMPGTAVISATAEGSKGLLLSTLTVEVKPFNLIYDCGSYTIIQEYAANAPIILPDEPVVYGCQFGGWDGLPENMLMPAKDLTVYPILLLNQYKVSFILDGELFDTLQLTAGEPITTPDVNAPLGLIFSGWTPEIPDEMPDYDLYFHGSYESASGIEEISKDIMLEEEVDIYTVNGILVMKNVTLQKALDKIPSGIYIVKSQEKVLKIKF